MNVTIFAEQENGMKTEVTFSDHNLDNDAFVNMWVGSSEVFTVSLYDLMPAVIAFDAKRSKRLSEEEHMQYPPLRQ